MSEEKRTLVSFDWAMKNILKHPEHFDVLEGFLAALLGDEKIKIMEILESESTQSDELDKYNRVDLKAKDGSGKIIIIELQVKPETDYLSRMYYGTSKVIMEYMRLGYAYGQMPKVISISIVYFDLMKNSYVAKSEMRFKDLNNSEYINGINEDNVFAEYYFIQPNWFDDNIRNALDEWVYMFKHSEIAEGSKSKNIERAKEALDFAKMTPQQQSGYDYFINISRRSALNTIDAAKNEGLTEGIEKGMEKGKLEDAVNFLKMGLTVEQVAQGTGLTIERVQDAKNSLK